MSDYERLTVRILAKLTGELLPDTSWHVPERNEQRVAFAVCKATGMTPERWDRLSEDERVPWLDATAKALENQPTPNAWLEGDDVPVYCSKLATQPTADTSPTAGLVEPTGHAIAKPGYPKPASERLIFAGRQLAEIEGYISPESAVMASLLVRALLARKCTTAEAMWAIHNQIEAGRYKATPLSELPSSVNYIVGETNPPAGLDVASGVLHIDGTAGDWGALVITLPRRHDERTERTDGGSSSNPPLAGLLHRASRVFSLASQLGWAFQQERGTEGGCRQVDPEGWNRHQPVFNEFSAAVLDLREVMEAPPEGFAPVAEVLREAARVAKHIRDELQTAEGRTWEVHLDSFPKLNSVATTGREAIREVTKARRLDDPFAFLDERLASKESGINTTPTLPKPPPALVELAARAIPNLFANAQPRPDGAIELIASHLAKRLQDAKHSLAAAQWAIHEAIQAGRLRAGPVEVELPSVGVRGPGGIVWQGGGRGTVAIPKEKPAPFDSFKLVATEPLWTWWHSLDAAESPANEPPADAGPPIGCSLADPDGVEPTPLEAIEAVKRLVYGDNYAGPDGALPAWGGLPVLLEALIRECTRLGADRTALRGFRERLLNSFRANPANWKWTPDLTDAWGPADAELNALRDRLNAEQGKGTGDPRLGQLIVALEESERAFAATSRTADEVEAKEGSVAAQRWRVQAAALRFQPDPARMPGIERIEVLCDELAGGTGLTLANVRQLRARLCRSKGCSLHEADAYSLAQVADALEIPAAGQKPLAATKATGSDPAKPLQSADSASSPAIALLRVFTDGVVDERIQQASRLLSDNKLTANEKLAKIDALIPFPATASAEQLGKLLGVTKQAVLKTDWWIQNRKGEKDNEIGRRHARYQKRAKEYESTHRSDEHENR
jgi:hypothetical protein